MKKLSIVVFAYVLSTAAAFAADLAFLKELVEIPSSSIDYPQVNRAMRAMKAYLEKRGLFCTVETDDQGRELLFAATKPGKVQDYILSAHLDVVPASYEGQYTFKNDNGRLSGRGVNDDKGGALAVAQALVALAGKDVSVGCIFGADEELGGFTTTWMVEKMGYRPRRMAIVVDSSYGEIGYATKGQLMVRATLTGKGGHSSAPWKCEDLISELSAAVVKIKEEWYRRHPMAEGSDHWSDVLTPTVVHSEGTALNRIPSEGTKAFRICRFWAVLAAALHRSAAACLAVLRLKKDVAAEPSAETPVILPLWKCLPAMSRAPRDTSNAAFFPAPVVVRNVLSDRSSRLSRNS